MKKSTKILLLGGILLVLVGGITMLVTGGILGGQKLKEYVQNGDFAITMKTLENLEHSFHEEEVFELAKTQIGTGMDVKNLDIEFGAGEFAILESEDEYIYLETKGTLPFVYGIDTKKTLYIKPESDKMVGTFGSIKLYLPANMVFDEVELELGAGELTANTLEMKALELSVAAGTISLHNIKCEQLDMEVGAGEAIVERGEVKNLTLELAMGEASLKLVGTQEDYDYDLNCGAGEVIVGTMSSSGLAFDKDTDFGREKQIKVDCTMGSVNVAFIQ